MSSAANPVKSWQQSNENEVLLSLTTPHLEEKPESLIAITAISDNILRVRHTSREEFSSEGSLMVMPQKPEGTIKIREEETKLILSTSEIRLEIRRDTGAFTWLDNCGRLLVKEPDEGGKVLDDIAVNRIQWEEDNTELKIEKTADGEKVRTAGGIPVFDRRAYSAKLHFQFSDNEAIYGLGQHEEGILNYRGRSQHLYQQNMKVAMPVIVSNRGYGCLLDANCLCIFRDNEIGSYLWADTVPELDYYFVAGPQFDKIVGGLRKLTGTPSMFPRWAYGYIQSKERYVTQEELLEIVEEYRRRKLPLDCIVQDWCTWPDGQWGFKTFDRSRFPDPEELCRKLHKANTRLMVSIWPIMHGEENEDRKEMLNAGGLLGNKANYNAFDQNSRKLYWQQAKRGYFDYGIDAWWCDCTEPFEADWSYDVKPEPEMRLRIDVEEAKKYLDPADINAYSLVHSKGIYEGQRETTEDKRVVNLTRSGYPGQQRYGAITWSGDIEATWTRLRKQIADGLNFCVTGNPRWTLDIGGFFIKPGPPWFKTSNYPNGCEDLGYRELYTRWFQFGAFLPMFRSHGTDTPREIWRFGEPGEMFYDAIAKFASLRYRLLPYIYSVAAQETTDDYTMFRLLAFDFRQDPDVWNIADQFMFGPALMICPVTEAMYYEKDSHPLEGIAKSRSVYLPDGCQWFDFWTGKRYEGGQTVTAEATLEKIPIFVRSGSIIPFGPEIQYTDEMLEAAWDINIYPGADSIFTVYEDEGDNYNYEKGAAATYEIKWDDNEEKLSISGRQGKFEGMAEKRTLNFRRVIKGSGYPDFTSFPAVSVEYGGSPETRKLD